MRYETRTNSYCSFEIQTNSKKNVLANFFVDLLDAGHMAGTLLRIFSSRIRIGFGAPMLAKIEFQNFQNPTKFGTNKMENRW